MALGLGLGLAQMPPRGNGSLYIVQNGMCFSVLRARWSDAPNAPIQSDYYCFEVTP